MKHQVIRDNLAENYQADVIQGKGGFWVKGHGFITLAAARKITGIPATTRRVVERQSAWGDYATIAMLNKGSTT